MRTAIPAELPARYVVDASVAMAAVWPDAYRPAAHRFFANAQKQWYRLIAPEFWLVECANACWKRVQRRLVTPEEALEALRMVAALPVTRIDATHLSELVLAFALDRRITAYDALYVAIAEFADVPLITADAGLVAALREGKWPGHVEHLSEW